jgi:hypothetical protein
LEEKNTQIDKFRDEKEYKKEMPMKCRRLRGNTLRTCIKLLKIKRLKFNIKIQKFRMDKFLHVLAYQN